MAEFKNKKIVARWILIIKALIRCALAVLFFGLALFLPAGSLKFKNGWLFIETFVIIMFGFDIYLLIKDPDLLEKRMKANEKENSQRVAMIFLILAVLLTFVISGFDYRLHLSSVPVWIIIIFELIMIAASIMFCVVIHQNSYASRVIEIQEEQKLIDAGLYSLIRHPMYFAASIIFCFSPLILGSYYAFSTAIFIPIFICMRIKNEEMVLKKGLKGYDLYMERVKYKLIPFIW